MKQIAFVFLIAALAMPWPTPAEETTPWRTLGDKAPELNVDFVKGDPIAIEQPAGTRVFVIEFWATWCGPCRYTAPKLSALEKKFGEKGLVVIGVSDEDEATVKPFLEKQGQEMEFRVAIDRARTTSGRYFDGFGRANTLPSAFVIDGNGRVAWIGNPLNPFLETFVERLVNALPHNADDAGRNAEKPDPALRTE